MRHVAFRNGSFGTRGELAEEISRSRQADHPRPPAPLPLVGEGSDCRTPAYGVFFAIADSCWAACWAKEVLE